MPFKLRIVLVLSAALVFQARALAKPVYEQIVAFRPTPLSPGDSLFRHSDGSLYGFSSEILYRVTREGEVVAFAPIRGLSTVQGPFGARDFFEAQDGSLWGTNLFSNNPFSFSPAGPPNVFRFDPGTERVTTIPLPQALRLNSGLVADPFGFLWGTARRGGESDDGVIYKLDPANGSVRIVHSFGPLPRPRTRSATRMPLLRVGEEIWGTNVTRDLAPAAIFTINTRHATYKEVGSASMDSRLFGAGELSRDATGNLWCTTVAGAIVRVFSATHRYDIVAEFPRPSNPAVFAVNLEPRKLVSAKDDAMWGTTLRGSLGGGSLFKVDRETGALTVIAEFQGYYNAGESVELGELVEDGAGSLWVTTKYGGAANADRMPGGGSLLKINIATGVIATVVDFAPFRFGPPGSVLTSDGLGKIWGTLHPIPGSHGGTVFNVDIRSGEVITLGGFDSRPDGDDGLFPGTALVSGRDGNLWGAAGRLSSRPSIIYKVDPVTWRATTVVAFTDEFGETPGEAPVAPLAVDGEGMLWGTATDVRNGGFSVRKFVFKVNPETGAYSRVVDLPEFTSVFASLVYNDVDSIWGTFSDKRLFKVNVSTGALTLFAAVNPSYGEEMLTSDGAGFLWGFHRDATKGKGDYIFKIDTKTAEVTKVAVFKGTADHVQNLTRGADGFLWGSVGIGPLGREHVGFVGPGVGAVFRLHTATGKLNFMGNVPGLSQRHIGVQMAPLVFDGANAFFGATARGGTRRLGSIFRVDANGYRTLFAFTGNEGKVPGAFPAISGDQPVLVRHTDGNLYGSTVLGGMLEDGTAAGGGVFYRIRFGPTPVTLPVEGMATSVATLSGTINPNGSATTVSFDLGVDPTLSSFVTIPGGRLGPLHQPRLVNAPATGLEPDRTYYYRIVGQNAENTHRQIGQILSFKTNAVE